MKAPRFWYPLGHPPFKQAAMRLTGLLLSPLSLFLVAASVVRRLFTRPYRSRVPVICVGNAVAGGAGKTPTALALARMFIELGHKPVFVTRGYGGRAVSDGQVVFVDAARHIADEVGDEALLLAAAAPTWAGRDRVAAIRQAESHGTVIIMDDGLQNPNIAPTASILVADGEAGNGNGFLMPGGPMRESFASALRRCGALVVIGEEDKCNLSRRAERAKIPVLRARLKPDLPKGFPLKGRFVAFAGIARPQKFYDTARGLGLKLSATLDFPDHHPYDQNDIDALRMAAEEHGARLLTTAKDAVRLPPAFRVDVIVLPVSLIFEQADAASLLTRLARDLI
jgi:tetraacyldisaccharide 4'-kinase